MNNLTNLFVKGNTSNPCDLHNYQIITKKIFCFQSTAVHVGVKCISEWKEFALNIDAEEHGLINAFPRSSNWESLLVQACQADVIHDQDRRYGYKRRFAADVSELLLVIHSSRKFLVRSSHNWQITQLHFHDIPSGKPSTFLAKAIQRANGSLRVLRVTRCDFSKILLSYLAGSDCGRSFHLRKFIFDETSEVALLLAVRLVRKAKELKTVGNRSYRKVSTKCTANNTNDF